MATILVVDDEQPVRELLTRLLTARGHEVMAAEDGRAATVFLEWGGVDLVLIDLVMPEQEGLETIQELRKRDRLLPVIAISGADVAFLRTAVLLGATRMFEKPFDPRKVVAAVEEELARRPAA